MRRIRLRQRHPRLGGEQSKYAVRERGATPRSAHDVELGWWRIAARDGVERRSGAHGVALHKLVHALRDERITQRVHGVRE